MLVSATDTGEARDAQTAASDGTRIFRFIKISLSLVGVTDVRRPAAFTEKAGLD
jgi:hypothetical protein